MSQRLRQERAAHERRSRWRLVVFVVAGILGAALLVALGALALILHTATPPAIHTDPAAAQRLRRELEKAQTEAASGTQGMVQTDETELNSFLKEYLQANTSKASADGTTTVRDLKVNLSEDRLRLYVLANFHGKDLTFVLEGKVHSANGYLDFEPVSGKIGSLSIPRASLKRAVEQMRATPETQELMRLPTNLHDLRVKDGKLVVVFK
jgi:hypothetical protein